VTYAFIGTSPPEIDRNEPAEAALPPEGVEEGFDEEADFELTDTEASVGAVFHGF
jgi:hypothetical protein